MDVIRRKLHEAILDSREDMQSLSLAAGKNRTYLQQYIRRGQPKYLPADVALAVCDKVDLDWHPRSPRLAAAPRNHLQRAAYLNWTLGPRLALAH